MKTILLTFLLLNSAYCQYPLDIISNNVVGAGGIWVGKTTLNEARQNIKSHKHLALNFTYDDTWKDSGDAYFAVFKNDGISMYWTIAIDGGKITKLFMKTYFDNFGSDEGFFSGVYETTVQDRTAMLGYPNSQMAGLNSWSANDISYDPLLIQDDSGNYSIVEAIYLNPVASTPQ